MMTDPVWRTLMRSSYAFQLLLVLAFAMGDKAFGQTPVEAFSVTEEMDVETHEINAADFATPLASYNGATYYTYIDRQLRGIVAKRLADGTTTEQVVIEDVAFNDHHIELSLAVDNDGYIHFTGNMHGHPMQYWRSTNPEDITDWTFYGNDATNGGIYGGAVTYTRFVKNRKGTLFLCYRVELHPSSEGREPGWLGGAIARYDIQTKRWTRLGSLNYEFTNAQGEQVKGNDLDGRNEKVVVWDESGIGKSISRAYQGYKIRMVIDKNDRMHLTWNIGRDKDHITKDLALEGTHIMYAYSDDEGDTWHKADGTRLALPMTTENADIVFQSPTARLGNFIDITLNEQGQPIILQPNFEDPAVIMVFRWNGTEWEKVNYTAEDGWVRDLGFAVGWPGMAVTDLHGVITSFDQPNTGTISRSWDGGATWESYKVTDKYVAGRVSVDMDLLFATGDVRFQAQSNPSDGPSGAKVVTVDFTSNDDLTPPPIKPNGAIAYTSMDFSSYGNNEDDPLSVAEFRDTGSTVYLEGNAWKKVGIDYTITPETILEFDYKSTKEAEIQGIGLDEDSIQDNGIRIFQLSGSETWPYAHTDFKDYTPSDWKHYRIPVGEYYTGQMQYLALLNDHDQGAKDGNASFRNIRLYDQLPQTITFDPVEDGPFGTFDLVATATSTLPVSFSVVSGAADIVNENLLVTQSTGTITVEATQAGNGLFLAAEPVQRSFNVAKANQEITIENTWNRTYGDAPFELQATATSGLPVVLDVISGPISINENTVTITGAGEAIVKGSVAGNENYFEAEVQDTITISKASQTITFEPIGDITIKNEEDLVIPLSATASSGLPITFEVISGPASVEGDTLTLDGTEGRVIVWATQSGNENYEAAEVAGQLFEVTSELVLNIEIGDNEKCYIYPNPAEDLLKIEFDNIVRADISIYDGTGKEIFQEQGVKNAQTIDVSTYSSGMYHIYILTNNGTVHYKLLVK